jgi:prepilin-type N-terminal cleavage/methylation domain-containing protein
MAVGAAMRKRGFTLIELLVVISILVLLMGLLLPAIIGAKKNMTIVQARGQISDLSKGIGVYYQTFNCLPGVPTPWLASQPATGAQLLQQALVGYNTNNNWPDGVTRQPLHAVHPGELVAHSQSPLNSAVAGNFNGAAQVFVDYMFDSPRPILYYRYYETWSGSQNADMNSPYNFNDNAVYCMPGETLASNNLGTYIGPGAASAGYVLISAGPDRQYFSSSCLCSVSKF